jgi:predicted HicB family RNase H-like nuclease
LEINILNKTEVEELKKKYGFVYFFIKEGTMEVKIGESDDPTRRLIEISNSSGEELTELNRIFCENPKELEGIFKQIFAVRNKKTEWFKVDSADLFSLRVLDFHSIVNKYISNENDVDYFLRRIEEKRASGRGKQETRIAIKNVKINKTTHEKLGEMARLKSTTINGLVANIIEEYVSNQDTANTSGIERLRSKIEQNDDDLFQKVLTFVLHKGEASSRSIVKQFRIGEKRADRLMDRLEREGYIEPKKGPVRRKLL